MFERAVDLDRPTVGDVSSRPSKATSSPPAITSRSFCPAGCEVQWSIFASRLVEPNPRTSSAVVRLSAPTPDRSRRFSSACGGDRPYGAATDHSASARLGANFID